MTPPIYRFDKSAQATTSLTPGGGLPSHFIASTTNGTSGNATFGMTSGTNGCSTDGTLTYGGRSLLTLNGMLDELSEDMAKGEGEALTTYAVLLGVAEQDRAHFAAVTHSHFSEIFSSADITAEQVHAATLNIIKRDNRLAKYANLLKQHTLPAACSRQHLVVSYQPSRALWALAFAISR